MTVQTLDLVQVSPWTLVGTRKREAVRAAHSQDFSVLFDLLEYHLHRYSIKSSRISPYTTRTYKHGLGRFLRWVGPAESPKIHLLRLEHDHIREWFYHLTQTGHCAKSIRGYVCGVRSMYRSLVWAGAIHRDPFEGLPCPKDRTPQHARKRALSLVQYADLLEQPARTYAAMDPRIERDRAMIGLGASCGLRGMEICALDLGDIRLEQSELIVQHGKGDKYRAVPISGMVAQLLLEWLEVRRTVLTRAGRPEDQHLLLSFQNRKFRRLRVNSALIILNDHLTRMGLPPEYLGLHTLRRTAGTHLYKATRDLHVVADVLGHSSVNTAAIYAQLDQSVRLDALEAMEALRVR